MASSRVGPTSAVMCTRFCQEFLSLIFLNKYLRTKRSNKSLCLLGRSPWMGYVWQKVKHLKGLSNNAHAHTHTHKYHFCVAEEFFFFLKKKNAIRT